MTDIQARVWKMKTRRLRREMREITSKGDEFNKARSRINKEGQAVLDKYWADLSARNNPTIS
jgi:hypothetical protein